MRRCLLVAGAAAVCLTAGISAPPAGARGVVVEARLSGVVSVERVTAAYADPGSFYLDPLASRCPGPGIADVAAASPLARGSVPIEKLRRRRVSFSLQRQLPFESDGYVGGSRSSVSFMLRRAGVEMGPFIDFVPRP